MERFHCSFKDSFRQYYRFQKYGSLTSLCKTSQKYVYRFGSSHPSLRVLILLMLTIPANTAGVERFFNAIKTLLNKKRNRMSEDTASKLIMIMCFIEEEHEFDMELLEKIWASFD